MSELVAVETADGFVLDIDGCLVLSDRPGGVGGGEVIPGAGELVRGLKDAGKRVLACTNGSSAHPATYAAGLRTAGIPIDDDEVLTPLVAGVRYLLHHNPGARVLSLGGAGMEAVLTEAGFELAEPGSGPAPDAVFVGWNDGYGQQELGAACLAVADGAALLVTARSPWFAKRDGRGVGLAGLISAGIQYVTGVEPTLVGKPSPLIVEAACELLDLPAERLVVVGDDPVAEVEMGKAHGTATVLVLSGITGAAAAADLPTRQHPDLTVENVGELARLLFQESGMSSAGIRSVGGAAALREVP